MPADDRPYSDREYEDEIDDEPREADSSFFGYPTFGWWPPAFYGRRADEDVEDTYGDTYDERYDDTYDEEEGTWLDEGLISLLILVGVVLFFFPEPATSGIGILLIGAGVILWLIDWAT